MAIPNLLISNHLISTMRQTVTEKPLILLTNDDGINSPGLHAVAAAVADLGDLLIVAPSGLPRFKRSRELYKLLRPYPFAMDLIVYTPEELERGKRSPVSFVSTVLREGKTLYVRRDPDCETVADESHQ